MNFKECRYIKFGETGNAAILTALALTVIAATLIGTHLIKSRNAVKQMNSALSQEESFYANSLSAESRMSAEANSETVDSQAKKMNLTNSFGPMVRLSNMKKVISTANRKDSGEVGVSDDEFCGKSFLSSGQTRENCLRLRRKLEFSMDNGYCIPVSSNVLCPDGYAAFGFTDPSRSTMPKMIDTRAFCCRVPKDLLVPSDTTYAYNDCGGASRDRVVTGGTTSHGEFGKGGPWNCMDASNWSECKMRCTKINTNRYKLAPNVPAAFYYQTGTTSVAGMANSIKIPRDKLPIAMRYATSLAKVKTLSPYNVEIQFEISGCVPPSTTGMIMTRKNSKNCGDMAGAQILYTGNVPGDVKDAPVQLLPNCTATIESFNTGVKDLKGERYLNFHCTGGVK